MYFILLISYQIMTSFREKHIYFGGAAFACSFYIGVVKALRELYPDKIPYIHSDSAGSLVGLGYALNVPTEDIEQVYFDSIKMQKERNNRICRGKISQDHDFIIDTFLQKGDFELIRRNKRFSVGVTSFFNRHTRYSNWESPSELRRFMHKTMIIPFLTKNDFALAVDGAYSNHQQYDLCIGTRSTFDICQDISFMKKVSIPTAQCVQNMIKMGYDTTMKYSFQEQSRNNRYNDSIFLEFVTLLLIWTLKFVSYGAYVLGIIE